MFMPSREMATEFTMCPILADHVGTVVVFFRFFKWGVVDTGDFVATDISFLLRSKRIIVIRLMR